MSCEQGWTSRSCRAILRERYSLFPTSISGCGTTHAVLCPDGVDDVLEVQYGKLGIADWRWQLSLEYNR